VELLTPYVIDSEHPNTEPGGVPWWWDHDTPLRRRQEKLVEQRDGYDVAVIDHGQVVGYGGSAPVETAKNGVLGIGTHSKYGFGEVRVKPIDATPDS